MLQGNFTLYVYTPQSIRILKNFRFFQTTVYYMGCFKPKNISRYCPFKHLRTLNSFNKFKIKIKKLKTYCVKPQYVLTMEESGEQCAVVFASIVTEPPPPPHTTNTHTYYIRFRNSKCKGCKPI
jgi:hypothetical protein